MENIFGNKKSLKKSIKRLSSKLQEKGYTVQHSVLLESVAAFMGYKDWNTLVAKTPEQDEVVDLKRLKKRHIKTFQIVADDSLESTMKMLEKSFMKANALFNPISSTSIGDKKIITIDCTKNCDNVITATIYFVKEIKRRNIEVKEILISRETQEVEDLSDLMKMST